MNQEYMERMNQVYIGLDLHKYTHTAVAMDCFSKHLVTIEIENKPSEFDKLISVLDDTLQSAQTAHYFRYKTA